jgi:leucyl aminopeptidase (aminopeptidase T)
MTVFRAYSYDPVTEGLSHIIEPIVCKVKNGKVIGITGGAQAKRLDAMMKASDANASNFAEMFMGFNPAALPNSGSLIEDERSAGSFGIGLGRNTHLMGKVESNFHFDGTLNHGSFALDGQAVIENRKFKI